MASDGISAWLPLCDEQLESKVVIRHFLLTTTKIKIKSSISACLNNKLPHRQKLLLEMAFLSAFLASCVLQVSGVYRSCPDDMGGHGYWLNDSSSLFLPKARTIINSTP